MFVLIFLHDAKSNEKRMQEVIFHCLNILLQNKENCWKVYSLN
jgi:hypothetical protein